MLNISMRSWCEEFSEDVERAAVKLILPTKISQKNPNRTFRVKCRREVSF